MNRDQTVITYAKRTPIGRLSGSLSRLPAPKLAATLVRDALEQTKIKGETVDEIIMGNVLTGGVGQAPARQAALYGGLPNSVCATTINRVCGSGIKSIMLADQAIQLGDAHIVFAGGMESMTQAPHMLPNSRAGFKFGSVELKDHMQHDGLWDPYGQMAMGNCGDICAKEYGFTREAQDEYALESYARARKAIESGFFKNEIIPVEVKDRKTTEIVDTDDEPFAVDLAKLAKLKPAFDNDGTVTAGNASSINDGAALTILTDRATAEKNGLKPLAHIIAQASHAQEPTWFTTSPVGCIQKLLEKSKLTIDDIDLFEINEAFAVVPMAAMKELNIPHEKVNIWGGAVSLGHPIGASGTRIIVTLLNAMIQKGAKRGLATLCIGGGEASGIIIERD